MTYCINHSDDVIGHVGVMKHRMLRIIAKLIHSSAIDYNRKT